MRSAMLADRPNRCPKDRGHEPSICHHLQQSESVVSARSRARPSPAASPVELRSPTDSTSALYQEQLATIVR